MNIYIPFAIIAIFLCIINRQNTVVAKRIFFITFFLAFIFAAFRYEFGPDYINYRNSYEEVKAYGASAFIQSRDVVSDPLFRFYQGIFFNYTIFLAFNSLLWFGISYYIYRKNIKCQYYWFLVLFLFFNVNCILNNLTAIRQSIAGSFVIIAFLFLNTEMRWKRIWCFLVLFLASMFHISALVLLPLAFLNKKRKSFLFTKEYLGVVVVLAFIAFLNRGIITQMIAGFMVENIEEFARYQVYIEQIDGGTTGVASMIKYAVLLLLNIIPLYYISVCGPKEKDDSKVVYYKIGIIIATIAVVLGGGTMSRFIMMLNPFYIIAIIGCFDIIKDVRRTVILVSCVAVTSIYAFYFYLQNEYSESFLEYHSVFSAPFIP